MVRAGLEAEGPPGPEAEGARGRVPPPVALLRKGAAASPENVESRIPPHDLEAEAATVSACLCLPLATPAGAPEGMAVVAPFLAPEHFFSESHRRIFEGARELFRHGQRPDVVLVAGWLRDRDRLAQVGGFPYLTEVLNAAPCGQNVRAYGERVHALWGVRELLRLAQEVTAAAYGSPGDPRSFVKASAKAFERLAIATSLPRGAR